MIGGLGLRLAGSAVPALAAGLGLTMGAPAVISNIRGRQTGFNNPTASGIPGSLIAGATGFGPGGLVGGGLSALAYKQGREAGKKKRIENIMYDQMVQKQINPDPKPRVGQERMINPNMIPNVGRERMINPNPMGTAMGIANQIYGMQQ